MAVADERKMPVLSNVSCLLFGLLPARLVESDLLLPNSGVSSTEGAPLGASIVKSRPSSTRLSPPPIAAIKKQLGASQPFLSCLGSALADGVYWIRISAQRRCV